MVYRQKFEDLELLDANLEFHKAFEFLSLEIAANLYRVNNKYCKTKYESVYDVFWGFPANQEEYDDQRNKLMYLANDFICIRYALLDADEEFQERVFRSVLMLREKIKEEMRKLISRPPH